MMALAFFSAQLASTTRPPSSVGASSAASMMRSWWPALTTRGSAKAAPLSQAAAAWQHAALDILGQGIRPVHRRAVANAKRLGRHGRR